MLTMPALPTRITRMNASLIYTERHGRLVVDRLALDPGTFAEVVGLGLMFGAFLAGILSLGAMM